jgi:hypothetical protein
MVTYEDELEELRPLLGDEYSDARLARERRQVFSVDPEVRFCAWGGASLLAAAAGVVLKNNLERIGPLALALLIALAAAACYAFVWLRRARASAIDPYILLLGGLLVSADAAFVEKQFHLLGADAPRHFLWLALIHAAGAYLYGSRMLLSLSVAALAAWFGIERALPFDTTADAPRYFVCAAIVFAWRLLHARLSRHDFGPVFEHAVATLAFAGGFAMMVDHQTRALGCFIVVAIAAAVIAWGFYVRRELFVLYAFIYAVIAVDVLVVSNVSADAIALLFLLVSTIAAIAVLLVIHARFHEARPRHGAQP